MNRILSFLFALAAALSAGIGVAPAFGQLANDGGTPLSAEEARAGLFGVDMHGLSPTFGMEWRECIDPAGNTVYETPGLTQKGKLRVTVGGLACFSYDDDDFTSESCFTVKRTSGGFIFNGARGFDSDDTGSVFVTTSVRPGIKRCPAGDDLIG
ncbi:MAG: hypothetical protein R3C52_08860 [Hyphomonadaceae bacterium]